MTNKYDFDEKRKKYGKSGDELQLYKFRKIDAVEKKYNDMYPLLSESGRIQLYNAVDNFFSRCYNVKNLNDIDNVIDMFEAQVAEISNKNKFDFSKEIDRKKEHIDVLSIDFKLNMLELQTAVTSFEYGRCTYDDVMNAYRKANATISKLEIKYSEIVSMIEDLSGNYLFTNSNKEIFSELLEKYDELKKQREELLKNREEFANSHAPWEKKPEFNKHFIYIKGNFYFLEELAADNFKKWNDLGLGDTEALTYGIDVITAKDFFYKYIVKQASTANTFSDNLSKRIDGTLRTFASGNRNADQEFNNAKKELKELIKDKEWLGDISAMTAEIDLKTTLGEIDDLKNSYLSKGKATVNKLLDMLPDTIKVAGEDVAKADIKAKVDACGSLEDLIKVWNDNELNNYYAIDKEKAELKALINSVGEDTKFFLVIGKSKADVLQEIDNVSLDKVADLKADYFNNVTKFLNSAVSSIRENRDEFAAKDDNGEDIVINKDQFVEKVENLTDPSQLAEAIQLLNDNYNRAKDLKNNKGKKVIGIKQAGSNLLSKMKAHKGFAIGGAVAIALAVGAIITPAVLAVLPEALAATGISALGYEGYKAFKK